MDSKKDNKFFGLINMRMINRDQNLKRLLLITVGIFVIMSLLVPGKFLSVTNLTSMAFQFPEFGLLSLGMLLAMLTGGIDLSVVGTANLSGILSALIFTNMLSPESSAGSVVLVTVLAIGTALLTGLVAGFLNGYLIGSVGIPAILATLGTMQLYTGIAIVLTEGSAVFGFPEGFLKLGNESFLSIPIPFVIFLIIAVFVSILLNKTPQGFKTYMLGSNPTASRFSGINNKKIQIKTYMIIGLLASIAGIILISRTNSAKADYGTTYTLQAILVAVLGGVNPSGGFGKVMGIVLAVFSLQFLQSGFNMLRFSPFFGEFMWGALLLFVMVFNYMLNKRQDRLARGQ